MAESRIIHGFHAVTARIRQNADSVLEVFVDTQRRDPRARDLLKLAESNGVRVIQVDGKRLDGMAGSTRHQGVAARVDAAQKVQHLDDVLDTLTEPALLLVLDGVQDPHNLGACLRSADAFGVHAVIAPKDRAVGINATVEKVACGAAQTVPYITVTNLARTLRELQERDIWVIGMDGEAETNLYDVQHKGAVALVLGAEGEGLRRLTKETCDQLVRIPMFGSVESLNVSVSTGVCLYEARRQRAIKQ
ncbi:23S rRNA (guanosine-2'-O-)-methyltransferase RlmB [mine drainage metagenome]|jgi:23S rRNA (guanosine2251-2'-O)-methyltransferase|uniref:23S rRNA (Guanosine-2'-O-)-methyltransferase RlmB n=1 Tax=mine drainage metagenome TaxID=410659 RepID=A0A1J5SZH0_9ZZZZ